MIVIDGCHIATMDAGDTEHAGGHIAFDGPRIAAVGPGPARTCPARSGSTAPAYS